VLILADHNIDINIKDTTSAKSAARPSAGGKVTTQLEPASIQKLEKAYEKVVLKAFNFDKISDSIAKEISKIMSPAKGQKSEGLSKGDLDRVVRDATSTLTKQLQQFVMGSLSKIASSASPGGLSDKKIVDVISGLDKHIQEAVKDLGRQIEKKTGRAVGPENAAAISKGVTDIIQKAIPTKELDAAARELSNAVGSIKGIVKEIGSIATSIGKMRSSGGGVDITEIKPMLQSLKRLFSEADNLGTAIKQGRDSAKGLVKAEKDAYIELSKALTDVKRAAREKVTRVKEQATGDPQQFAKTVSKELQKLVASVPSLKGTQLDKSISGLGTKVENLSDVADAIKDLGKEIKNQIQIGKINSENTKSLVDAMGNLNANLQDLPKTFGNKSTDKVFSGLEKFTSKTEELLQTVKVVLDETDIKKQIESAAKGAKIEVEADVKLDAGVLKEFKSSFDKIVQDLTKKAGTIGLYPSMDLESKVKKFKSAFEEGKPGAVRNIALDIQKMPEAKEFSSALKTFADDLALGSSLKDVDTTSKKIVASEKKFATEVDKTADTLAATRGVMDALKKREEKRTMGPLVATRSALESYNIRKYSGKVIPPGELEFSEVEKTGVGFGKKAEGSVKKNVEELAKSLKELQDYMVSELEKQLEGGSSGWKIVRENSEQAVNEYFKLATGGSIGNIKSSGKQWAVQIANIDKIRKDLGKGFEAASPTKVVEAFKQSLIEQEVVGKSAALRPQSIAKWVKSASNETIKGMDTLSKSQQEALVDLKGKFKGVEA